MHHRTTVYHSCHHAPSYHHVPPYTIVDHRVLLVPPCTIVPLVPPCTIVPPRTTCAHCAHLCTYHQSSVIAALLCSSHLSRTSSTHCAHRAPTSNAHRAYLKHPLCPPSTNCAYLECPLRPPLDNRRCCTPSGSHCSVPAISPLLRPTNMSDYVEALFSFSLPSLIYLSH